MFTFPIYKVAKNFGLQNLKKFGSIYCKPCSCNALGKRKKYVYLCLS